MTDKERLIILLNEFGVGFKEKENNIIRCKEGYEKVDGHFFYYTDFEFDEHGSFIQMGVWEQ